MPMVAGATNKFKNIRNSEYNERSGELAFAAEIDNPSMIEHRMSGPR